jgi:hypothetical protein
MCCWNRPLIPAVVAVTVGFVSVYAGTFPNYSLEDGDQDARIETGMHGSLAGQQAVFGDVNNDGRPDAAFFHVLETPPIFSGRWVYSNVSVLLSLGGRLSKILNLNEDRSFSLYESTFIQSVPRSFRLLQELTDWDGDGKKDFILYDTDLGVFWGRDAWTDQDKDSPDFRTLWPTSQFPSALSLYAGDVDGDGNTDLVMTSTGFSSVHDVLYIVPMKTRLTGSVLLDSMPDVKKWDGYSGCLKGRNPVFFLDADTVADLVLSRGTGLDIFWGSTTIPSTWNASNNPPVRVTASPGWSLDFDLAADRNGDGRLDAVVREQSGSTVRWRLVSGAVLGAQSGIVSIDGLSPTLLRQAGMTDTLAAAGDFDGDGRDDLVWSSTGGAKTVTALFLADEALGDGSLSNTPSITIDGEAHELDEIHLVDMDLDGRDDLWIIQKPGTSLHRWHINLFYGFEPLTEPEVRVVNQSGSTKRADLEFSVRGSPVEMKLSGGIDDPDKDRWVAYQPRRTVEILGTPGPKTVSVVFRQASGRESAPATVDLTVANAGVRMVVVTNRIGRGGSERAQWDCFSSGGRLRATVFERGGRKVRTLLDEDVNGTAVVYWDGLNESQERVRSGMYVIAVEADGRTDRGEVLVEW